MQDESLYRDLGMVGKDFLRLLWQRRGRRGHAPEDALGMPSLREAERRGGPHLRSALTHGETPAIERREDPLPVLKHVYEEFVSMEIAERNKPVIGVVGEIYIRANRFGNEDVVGRSRRSAARRGSRRSGSGSST